MTRTPSALVARLTAAAALTSMTKTVFLSGTWRVPPEVHARVSAAAQVAGVSLNQWVTRALEQASHV